MGGEVETRAGEDSEMSHLQGRVALVTGAGRGIGAAAARALAGDGAAVVLAARSGDEIEEVAAEITAGGGRAMAIRADVAEMAALEAAVAAARGFYGPVDILVNNAGLIEPIGPLAQTDAAAWDRLIDVNVKGVHHGIRAVLPGMIEAGRGVIVNVSSGAATSILEGWSAYCASKAAVLMLTRAVHAEYAGAGIRSIGLSPGTVATDMQRAIRASGINPVSQLDWEAHIPPGWAGRAIAWCCTDDAGDFDGGDVSLRDEGIRRRVGLIG